MFFQVTAILLLSIEYVLASENSTIVQSLQSPEPTTSFGNATTRITETTENASNFVTESFLNISNSPQHLHPEPKIAIEPNENSLNSLKPRGKTKFIFHNTVQHALNSREVPRNELTIQDQNNYSIEQQLDDLQQRQQLQLATAEKEEFIQSELHNLAKDIAETELNREAGKTNNNNNSRPSSWKSFFSSIFPQGIMNVFHLSVTAEPSQKSTKQSIVSEGRTITSNEAYEGRKLVSDLSTLPITPPLTMTTQLLITPPLPTVSTIPSVEESVSSVLPTEIEETQQNGTVMTNKDVFDINSAAEVSEMPFETVIPMESSNIFHIHPLNCEENCAEESPEDYIDGEQLSESGDDNIVAFSRESPQNIFYPTPKPDLPYPGIINQLRNTDVYYSGTGQQTSEEIIRENMKNFGQKIPPVFHPAKQLDDFQKEVEKQFDHNEVRIDAEAASRKFLKHFKGKYVKPQESADSTQSSTFKGINHFELIASTLRPEINFLAQPSPVKPESQLHTYIYSPPKSGTSDSLSNYKTLGGERNVQIENNNGPPQGEKSSNSQNFFLPYPTNSLKPESLLHTYIYSAQQNSSSNSNSSPETPKPETKEITENSPNQAGSSNRYTNIYSKTDPNDNKNENPQNDNENNVQLYSTNLKPESLLHTYIYSAHDKVNNNSISSNPSESERSSKSEDISFSWVSNKPGPGLQSSKPPSTGKTYLCSSDQLKSGDCAYSTTFSPNDFYQPKDIIEIQKSYEQQVKHTKPYVYYTFPPNQQPMLSKNPIRVEQAEDSQQSESLIIPESYQQRQQYLQDQQKQLNQQQEYFQHHQIQQYQQKLQYQQQQKYIQDQQKQQKQLEEYQQKQQLQLQQYQQQQQNQQQQYEQLKQQQQVEQQYQQQQQYFQQKQQQQQEKQQQEQFLQVQQQQHNQQQMQKYQQQQMQYYQQHQQQQHQQQQEQQKKEQEQKKLIKYNTLKVEKIVPKPYPVPVKEIVEKIVERPVHVEHIVEKPINVPYPVREVVEKIVDRPYPVEKIIDRPVHIPYPVQVDHFIDRPYAVRVPVPVAVPVPVHQYIDRPYPVEKIIEKPIHVPYPVDKIVEKIVEKHIPVEVERIVEKPAPTKKPVPKKPLPVVHTVSPAKTTKHHKINPEELLELVPPPVDQAVHDGYKTLPDDIEFILIDDYNGPVPHDNSGYQWNKPEKRATGANHNIKRSPEFRRNLRVEYGFRPPLIPSVEIGEKGLI